MHPPNSFCRQWQQLLLYTHLLWVISSFSHCCCCTASLALPTATAVTVPCSTKRFYSTFACFAKAHPLDVPTTRWRLPTVPSSCALCAAFALQLLLLLLPHTQGLHQCAPRWFLRLCWYLSGAGSYLGLPQPSLTPAN